MSSISFIIIGNGDFLSNVVEQLYLAGHKVKFFYTNNLSIKHDIEYFEIITETLQKFGQSNNFRNEYIITDLDNDWAKFSKFFQSKVFCFSSSIPISLINCALNNTKIFHAITYYDLGEIYLLHQDETNFSDNFNTELEYKKKYLKMFNHVFRGKINDVMKNSKNILVKSQETFSITRDKGKESLINFEVLVAALASFNSRYYNTDIACTISKSRLNPYMLGSGVIAESLIIKNRDNTKYKEIYNHIKLLPYINNIKDDEVFFIFNKECSEKKIIQLLSYAKITIKNDQLIVEFFYKFSSNLFIPYFEIIWRDIKTDLNRCINSINILPLEEYTKVITTFNHTNLKIPNINICDAFKAIVNKDSQKIAVVCKNYTLTYNQIDQYSSQLACIINELLPTRDKQSIIGLGVSRSSELVLAILGILKSTSLYVPLDQSQPSERLYNIIKDVKPNIIIVDDDFLSKRKDALKAYPLNSIVNINTVMNSLKQFKKNIVLDKKINPTDLCYIIYTSGSTGKPKGVMIEHHSIVNLAYSEKILCKINVNSKIVSIATIGFDAIGWDIYGAILNGATLYFPEENIRTDPIKLHGYINKNNITMFTVTPAVLSLMPKKTLKSLYTLVVMGDVINFEILSFWETIPLLINGYGPTEATVASTLNVIRDVSDVKVIGRPIHNYKTYILDKSLNPIPIGIIGELYISGMGVARGYWKMDSLTKERFVKLKLQNNESIIAYKTGDLAKYHSDGRLEFISRMDNQVKIHGVRVEIDEIESILLKCSLVLNCVVKIFIDHLQAKQLAVYLVPSNKQKITNNKFKEEIKKYLAKYLHPSVVPKYYIILEKLPLNVNGKVDRKSLKEPSINDSIMQEEYVAPRDEVEHKICNIFTEILKVNNIGIFDDFFALGGHSLTATQIIARINEEFEVEIYIDFIFRNPSVFLLSKNIKNKFSLSRKIELTISKVRVGELLPAQNRLWFLYKLNPQDCVYNLPITLKLKGKLNIQALEKSINYMIQRHESLRTIFLDEDSPKQKVLTSCVIKIEVEEIKLLDLQEIILVNILQPFDLEKKPPIRINLYKLSADTFVLSIIQHNIITDAWSQGILLKELSAVYNSFLQRSLPMLDLIVYQAVDITNYIREDIKYVRAKQLDYWAKKLHDYKELVIITDYERPKFNTGKGYRVNYKFNRIALHTLKKIALNKKVSLYIVLMSALKILFHKYSGQEDIIIGTAIANRNIKELEKILSFLVNTIPIRSYLNKEHTFNEVIDCVKESCIEAYSNQNVQFEEIVERLKVERTLNKTPIFQIMMILQNANEEVSLNFSDVKGELLNLQTHTSMFDMTWNFYEYQGKLNLNLDYSTDLFKEESIRTIISYFENILCELLNNNNLSIDKISVLSDKQKKQILKLGQGEKRNLIFPNIVSAIDKSIKQNANKIAVVTRAKSVTFKKLGEDVNNLSQYLYNLLDYKVQSKIGILLDRNYNMVVSIISSLKSGAIYIALDPEFPEERLQYMVKNSNLSIILVDKGTYEQHKKWLQKSQCNTIIVDDLQYAESYSEEMPNILSDNLAYIMYTSGSTGKPKGVKVTHQNLINVVEDFLSRIPCTQNDKWLSITTISFDIFALELFTPLVAGAELILCDREFARNPVHLANYFNDMQPSIMQATPTMWSIIIDHLYPKSKDIVILTGGEPVRLSLLEKLQSKSKKVLNVYGPTETTIWSTVSDITKEKRINIGNPIQNTNCYVLDEDKKLLPKGILGELYIGGMGVTQGYWKDESNTANKFLSGNFDQVINDKIIYNTGDLVYWSFDNKLYYMGRNDSQIKVHGQRFDISEIEYEIANYHRVNQVLVHVFDSNNNYIIVAYLILKDKTTDFEIKELYEFLQNKLPANIIPSDFILMEDFPRTNNNKIDYKLLPKPKKTFSQNLDKYYPPSNDLEKLIQSIWQEVLELSNISVKDNFFILGGNSLTIPKIITVLNKKFQVNITIRDFILHSTISELSSFMQNCNIKKK